MYCELIHGSSQSCTRFLLGKIARTFLMKIITAVLLFASFTGWSANILPISQPKLATQPTSRDNFVISGDGRLFTWKATTNGSGFVSNVFLHVAVPFPQGVTSWKAVSAGDGYFENDNNYGHILALGNNNQLYAWGK